jgi:DNA-binding response OmpR family regulator
MAALLVVDGDFSIRRRLAELLMTGGFHVRLVLGGTTGMDVFGPGFPSAVVLSLQSGGTSTQDLCRAIRQSAPAVPMIVVGPDIDVRAKVALFELGADDYIVQPFDSSEMLARLRATIRRSEWILGKR